uniref:Disease resistance protein At4g27190-like leucine-rich repeats domain-containing protein n=1 Tax=Leersia perrieri TaxID=77586 RepID=A0A0D9W2E9_9ORYZ
MAFLMEIFGWDIAEATNQILEYVQGRPEKKVIYFHGWDGFGASPVLRSIAQVLRSQKMDGPKELHFDRIIYIDCSSWKSRREMQRAIADELKLDYPTMAMFSRQDEEDDLNGLHHGSRDVIPSVATEIDRTLRDCRFMMIFLNGSDDEIDVTRFGIPQMTEFRDNRMIWTFKRRLMTIHSRRSEIAKKLRNTDLFFSAALIHGEYQINDSDFHALVHGEASSIVDRYRGKVDIDPTMVTDCCLLELSLHYNFHRSTRFGWASHSSNYWICNGIMQDTAREINNLLHGEIRWDCDTSLLHNVLKELKPLFLLKNASCVVKHRWISVTSQEQVPGCMQTIPATASSFFLAFERSDKSPASEISDQPTTLPYDMLKHSSNLAVLVLSYCSFSFTSPPFLACHGLRFLGLEHCKHNKMEGYGGYTDQWACLLSLWVLDLRYTDWDEMISEEKMDVMGNLKELNIEGAKCWQQYMSKLQKTLPHLYRLRISKPMVQHQPETTTSNSRSISFLEKGKLEILDLSGNSEMKSVPINLSKASSLQVLVLDGCDALERVDRLPPTLISFSLDGFGPASHWTPGVNLLPPEEFRPNSSMDNKNAKTSIISLEGCTQLENLFLRGLPNLVELDLSGTAIKILDFTTMVVQVPGLKRLFLIGCKCLRAITWDQKILPSGIIQVEPQLELLCIDTRAGIQHCRTSIDKMMNIPFGLQAHAIFADARLARSLWPAIDYYRSEGSLVNVYFNIHITSSSPVCSNLEDGQCEEAHRVLLLERQQYHDVHGMVGDGPMQVFPQAPTRELDRHVRISQESQGLESELQGYIPARNNLGLLMRRCAESLHLHDISTSINMPKNEWNYLRQCRVENCPKLDTVFPGTYGFEALEIIWASDLLMAQSIWSKGDSYYLYGSFKRLRHLQLRNCPRLQFVLPLPVLASSTPSLETLHIIRCGNLRHVFVLDEEHPKARVRVVFPNLTTIHFHDLPMLWQICEVQMLMVAPVLEAIKIRGCWGLRRLPAMEGRGLHVKKPTIEIEKDVWDALEWDGVNVLPWTDAAFCKFGVIVRVLCFLAGYEMD